MKFDHLVRHNGVDYPAGTEVPVGAVSKEETKQNVKKTAETVEPQTKGSKNSKKAQVNEDGIVNHGNFR